MFQKRFKLLSPFSLVGFALANTRFFAFDPEDADTKAAIAAAVAEAVDATTKKNKELLAEVKNLKKGQRDGGDNAAELERLETANEQLSSDLAKAQKDLKAAQKAAEDSGKSLASERAYTERLLVENGLAAALAAEGVTNASHAKAAAALIRSSSKIEIAVDGDNRTATVGGKPLSDFVKEWSQSDDGKNFVTAKPSGGGGAPGSQQQHQKPSGNLGGTREERNAALAARFPELNQQQ